MKRKFFLSFGLIVLVGLLVAAWKLWVVFYGTPAKVDTMATRQFAQFLIGDPETLTFLGLIDGGRFDVHSDDLSDRSLAGREARRLMMRDFRSQLDRYDPDALPDDQRLTWDVWSWWLDAEVAATEPFFGTVRLGPYVVDQFGVQSALPKLLTSWHSLHNQKLARNYLSRLSGIGVAVDQTITVFDDHADKGFIAPRFILERVITDIDSLVGQQGEQSPLVSTFVSRVEKAGAVDPDELARMKSEAIRTVDEIVNPAFLRYRAAIEQRIPEARTERPGLLGVPGGREYYDTMIRRYTTIDVDADALHDLGLREVQRISSELDTLSEELGYGDLSVPENYERFRSDASFGLGDDEQGQARLIEIATELIREAKAASKPFFSRFPKAKVEVRPIPDYAAGSAANSYSLPSRDGTRPGYYNLNASKPSSWGRDGLPSLTYHEAIPGHHYQLALTREMGLPILRANLPFPAYTEGWALYAETIAEEMGLYESNPAGRIGALRSELFRAVRLVVDTGLHAKGWSRNEAVDYMIGNLAAVEMMGNLDAVEEKPNETESPASRSAAAYKEVDRYVVMPGQALAYKVGQLEIARLRDLAEERLGEQFDIRQFHDQILSEGELPLPVLATRIDRWIEDTLDR